MAGLLGGATSGLHVPIWALIAALLTGGLSLYVYFFAKGASPYWWALATYIAVALTIGLLISTTGGIWSPFGALWLMVGVFAGLYGGWAWVSVWAVANAYLLFELFVEHPGTGFDRVLELVMAAEVPLIASYIIWHAKSQKEKERESQSVTKVTAQLSQVAGQADIIINSIADGVMAVDANGIIQLLNPAGQTILGWPLRDSIGLDYKSVVKLLDIKGNPLPDEASPIRQVLVSRNPVINNDLELMSKSGKKILVSLVISPLGDSTSGSGGVIVVFRDITREKEEERQKAEFISTASHEMRTPVAAIEGYLGLAMNPATAVIDEKARTYLAKAHESTQHLGRLFQDLLTVSKAEDARLVPHPTVIDIVALTREICTGLQQKAKDKGVFLAFKPGDQDVEGNRKIAPVYFAYADQDQIREVLNNLVDNAVKYTKAGSASVDITGTDQAVTVSVTDTGIGIPPEDVPHLFQKFYRVDNSDTREIGGTGLGLYISRRLIEANNGHIGLNSTYGKGSTFFVQLPRISHDQATSIINANAATAPPAAAAPAAPRAV